LVSLTLKTPEQNNLIPLTLTKQFTKAPSIQQGIISANTIKTQFPSLAQQTQDIGYIHLLLFTEDTVSELREVFYYQLRKNVQGVIIDLRNNPGGSLKAAVDIAAYFLARGKTIIHIN